MRSWTSLLVALAMAPVMALEAPVVGATAPRQLSPRPAVMSRTQVIRTAARAVLAGSFGTAATVLTLHARRLAPEPGYFGDATLGGVLRSSNELAPSRRALESEWRELRASPAGHARSAAAFAVILRARNAIDVAEAAARERRWAEVDAALPAALIREMESAATVLATSAVLDREARAAIGWQWGACGWRQCGAQADAAQALCKLRANMGMIVPLEGLFYLDVAKRAVDEIVAVGAAAGLGADLPPPPRSTYLPEETLEQFLVRDSAEGGDEIDEYLDEYEEQALREAGIIE